MSQQIQEQLSALMDGELPREETLFLLRRAGHDPGIAASWSRYHLVRQSLRRQEILPLRTDFATVVLAQVQAEALPSQARTGTSPWLRWASGGAIAASVAVAALMVTSPRDTATSGGAPLATIPSPATDAAGEFRPPLLSPPLSAQPASATTGGFNGPGVPIDPRLQSYLIRHYDAAGAVGQSAVMPYVLLVVPSQPQAARPANTEPPVESQQ